MVNYKFLGEYEYEYEYEYEKTQQNATKRNKTQQNATKLAILALLFSVISFTLYCPSTDAEPTKDVATAVVDTPTNTPPATPVVKPATSQAVLWLSEDVNVNGTTNVNGCANDLNQSLPVQQAIKAAGYGNAVHLGAKVGGSFANFTKDINANGTSSIEYYTTTRTKGTNGTWNGGTHTRTWVRDDVGNVTVTYTPATDTFNVSGGWGAAHTNITHNDLISIKWADHQGSTDADNAFAGVRTVSYTAPTITVTPTKHTSTATLSSIVDSTKYSEVLTPIVGDSTFFSYTSTSGAHLDSSDVHLGNTYYYRFSGRTHSIGNKTGISATTSTLSTDTPFFKLVCVATK